VEWIDHLYVRVEVSFQGMQQPQKEDAGFAAFQSFINVLGHKLIPALEQGLAQGPPRRRHPRGPGWPGGQGLPGQLVLLHQQVAGFGPHEHGPLGDQAQQELMVPAARLGQLGDDLGLPPAHGQTVLVEAHAVKRQG
jgi:hypothetical protein